MRRCRKRLDQPDMILIMYAYDYLMCLQGENDNILSCHLHKP